jgi:excisionase family DNA binding protein
MATSLPTEHEKAGQGPLDDERLISLTEAAAMSGISSGHLRHLAEQGKLSARKIGRNWVTTTAAVAEYLQNPELRSKDPYKNKRT